MQNTARLVFVLTLAACAAPDAIPPSPCTPACTGGQVCIGGMCFVPAGDAGADATADVPVEASADAELDALAPTDTTPEAAADAGVDATPMDAGPDAPPPVDAMVDVDPRQSEVCRHVTAQCVDGGPSVNVQTGTRLPDGRTTNCGGCGITCAAGEGCLTCVCVRL